MKIRFKLDVLHIHTIRVIIYSMLYSVPSQQCHGFHLNNSLGCRQKKTFLCSSFKHKNHNHNYPNNSYLRDCEDCCQSDAVWDTNDEHPTIESKRKQFSRRKFVAWSSLLSGAAVESLCESVQPSHAAYMPFSKEGSTKSSSTGSAGEISNSLNSIPVPFSSVRRNTRRITLANGMKVVLVNDKMARSASAALTIRGAGQFSDPTHLNGLAHLMEHITLSSSTRLLRRGSDFEDWLNSDYAEGFSNGFTAYEKVCFHFQCKTEVFPEALERFSKLFLQDVVAKSCQNRDIVRREIRRVNSELDRNDLFSRELYLTKSLINPQHPYSRMTMGSIETLERQPAEDDINVSNELYRFFQEKYRPSRAVLVVVSPSQMASLETWVQPFGSTLSKTRISQEVSQRDFPNFLLPENSAKTYCLYRRQSSSEVWANDLEKLSFQWSLDQDYADLRTKGTSNSNVVTATQIGFVMAEILGRRGPGSLFTLLKNRNWVLDSTKGLPRISFPLDVSGCQILRLELTLTLEGFSNRSFVIAAVFDCLAGLKGSPPSRDVVAQYCTVAQLLRICSCS